MATATVVREKVETLQDVVHLRLTMIEAQTLLKVLNNVGGPPAGPRGTVDGVANALVTAKVKPLRGELGLRTTENGSSFYFGGSDKL